MVHITFFISSISHELYYKNRWIWGLFSEYTVEQIWYSKRNGEKMMIMRTKWSCANLSSWHAGNKGWHRTVNCFGKLISLCHMLLQMQDLLPPSVARACRHEHWPLCSFDNESYRSACQHKSADQPRHNRASSWYHWSEGQC